MFKKIFNWFLNIGTYVDYIKGHAQKCDFCNKIVYGWFGTHDGRRRCMECAEANGPTIFTTFVIQHTKELVNTKKLKKTSRQYVNDLSEEK